MSRYSELTIDLNFHFKSKLTSVYISPMSEFIAVYLINKLFWFIILTHLKSFVILYSDFYSFRILIQ